MLTAAAKANFETRHLRSQACGTEDMATEPQVANQGNCLHMARNRSNVMVKAISWHKLKECCSTLKNPRQAWLGKRKDLSKHSLSMGTANAF